MRARSTLKSGTLEKFLIDVQLDRWNSQRKSSEERWLKNTAAHRRDPSLDPSGIFARRKGAKDWESDAMPDLTGHKCDTAHSMVTRVMFHGGRINYVLMLEDATVQSVAQGIAGTAPAAPADQIDEAVQLHQRLIDLQLEAFDALEEADIIFKSGAILGEGYALTYVTELNDSRYVSLEPGLFEREQVGLESKAFRYISPWDVFRDREVLDLNEGEGYAYRVSMSPLDFADFFLPDQMADQDEVLNVLEETEGEESGTRDEDDKAKKPQGKDRDSVKIARTLDVFFFWSTVPEHLLRVYAEAHQLDLGFFDLSELQSPEDERAARFRSVEIHAAVCNDRILRVVRVTRQDRPLREFLWKRLLDADYAVGVADDVLEDHRMLVKAVRQLENQMVLCCSLILAGKRDRIDGDFAGPEPYTFIDLDPNSKASDAMEQLNFDGKTGDVHAWIRHVLMSADLSGLIPRIQQGQPDGQDQRTLGELVHRLEQAGEYTLSVIRNADRFIEDLIRDMEDHNLRNPQVAPALKANLRVKANGVTTFTNRVIKQAQLMQLLDMAMSNPQLSAMTRIKWLWKTVIEAAEVNPDLALLTIDEMRDLASTLQQQQTAMGENSGEGGALLGQQIARLAAETMERRAKAEKAAVEAENLRADMTIKRAEAVAKLGQGGDPAQAAPPSPGAVAEPAGTASP